jgi:preprotein translocase subunit SecF
MQFLKPGTKFDFVGKRKYAAVVSVILVIASFVLFFGVGPNWGIDFTGGTEVLIDFDEPVEIDEVRDAMAKLDVSGDAIQQIGSDDEYSYVIRIQDVGLGVDALNTEVVAALVAAFGPDWIEETKFDSQVSLKVIVRYRGDAKPKADLEAAVKDIPKATIQKSPDENTFYVILPGVSQKITSEIKTTFKDKAIRKGGISVDSVGPKVGGELRRKGLMAIVMTLALVLVYVAFRFEFVFAPGAVLALFHDVSIVCGIFVLTRHEFNLPMIGALLTIIGYSLNDTIVIYDRIRENMSRYRRRDMAQLINDSVNETLTRTLATSFTTMMAMLAFLFLGGPVIETFALAILLGVIFGTYSTVFVASPTILLMEDLKPVFAKVFAPLAKPGADAEEPGAELELASDQPMSEARRRKLERRARRAAPAETEES